MSNTTNTNYLRQPTTTTSTSSYYVVNASTDSQTSEAATKAQAQDVPSGGDQKDSVSNGETNLFAVDHHEDLAGIGSWVKMTPESLEQIRESDFRLQ